MPFLAIPRTVLLTPWICCGHKAVLLLADPNGSTANSVKQYVNQHGDVDNAYVVGGESVVSRSTADGLADALKMGRP